MTKSAPIAAPALQPDPPADDPSAVAEAAELAGDAYERARQAARGRLEDQVDTAIIRESETEKECRERLAALTERLESDDAYDDVRGQPFREVVEQLCTETGFKPDWSDWTDDGWPHPPPGGPEARPSWSPFRQPSPRPILKQNQKYYQQPSTNSPTRRSLYVR